MSSHILHYSSKQHAIHTMRPLLQSKWLIKIHNNIRCPNNNDVSNGPAVKKIIIKHERCQILELQQLSRFNLIFRPQTPPVHTHKKIHRSSCFTSQDAISNQMKFVESNAKELGSGMQANRTDWTLLWTWWSLSIHICLWVKIKLCHNYHHSFTQPTRLQAGNILWQQKHEFARLCITRKETRCINAGAAHDKRKPTNTTTWQEHSRCRDFTARDTTLKGILLVPSPCMDGKRGTLVGVKLSPAVVRCLPAPTL